MMAALCLNIAKNGSMCFFVLPETEKIIHQMKFFEKSIPWSMPTKVQNRKKEGFSY